MRTVQRIFFLAIPVFLASFASLFPLASPVDARPQPISGYDLVNAVNNLRASRGLPAYSINPTLMGVAQSHSDYQASIGAVTHYGPGGTRPYQRALAAGYPVGGDLSLGGFYAENIMGGPGLTAQSVVNAWTGDSDHLNTMLSTNLLDVGGGVSCSDDYCYFTLDAAQPSGSPIPYTPPVGVTPVGTGGAVSTRVVVFPNTPDLDGSIKHVVKEGEVLYTIAAAYNVSVDEIKRLNKLTTNLIYPGDVLLIRLPAPPMTTTPASTGTPAPTFTPFVFKTVTASPAPTATVLPIAPVAGGNGSLAVAVIIVAALVLAGVFTAAGARKPK